jgi:peptidyl-prolyl cis-trans isomerase D
MLTGIRKAANNWLGRVVLTVVFGILILSFAVWGIGDIFRGYGQQTVAKVGRTEIGIEAFRRAYQQQIFEIQQRARGFTGEQARALGLDRQVLDRMVGEAALNEHARALGLGMSEEEIALRLVQMPAFTGPNGRFDRQILDNYLREVGLTEAGFLRDQRLSTVRQHLAEAVSGGVRTPEALIEAIVRYRSEQRDVQVITVPAPPLSSLPEPDDAALAATYERRKAALRAPEVRGVNVMVLEPQEFAAQITVSDDEIRQAYDEAVRAGTLGTPERRRIQQLVFPDAAAAAAASRRLKEGLAFDALATELKLAAADFDLGLKSRAEIIDRAAADAAFALPVDGISDPVQGRFGSLIVRVTAIEPGNTPALAAVTDLLRATVAQRRMTTDRAVAGKVGEIHDRIEDLRASGKTLAQVAAETGRPLLALPGVDAEGRLADGAPATPPLPDQTEVLRAVFQSDIGVDNEAVRTRAGGYVWFEVTRIDPARDRTLQEVRAEVVQLWRSEEAQRRSTERADAMLKRLQAGESMEQVATEVGGGVDTVEGVTRSDPKTIGVPAATLAFALPPEGTGAAAGPAPNDRVLIKVVAQRVPPFDAAGQEATTVRNQLDDLRRDELVAQYIRQVRDALGSTVNQRAMDLATGAATQ